MTSQITQDIPYFWLSAKKYSEQTNLGYEETLRQCETGELIAVQTDGGQWRIKVYKYESVPFEEYEKVLIRVTEAESKLEAVKTLLEVSSESYTRDNKLPRSNRNPVRKIHRM